MRSSAGALSAEGTPGRSLGFGEDAHRLGRLPRTGQFLRDADEAVRIRGAGHARQGFCHAELPRAGMRLSEILCSMLPGEGR